MIFLEPVQIAIWQCLESYAFEDAIFLAERLYAEDKNEENLFIVATSYYRSGQLLHAYSLIETNEGKSPACKYLLAKCAYNLDKLREAEDAIVNRNTSFKLDLEEIILFFGEYSSYVLQILGNVLMRSERHSVAVDVFKKALKINPLLWTCFLQICHCGEQVNIDELFDSNNLSIVNVSILGNGVAGIGLGTDNPTAVVTNTADTASTPQSENHENLPNSASANLCNSTPLPLSHQQHLQLQNCFSTQKTCYFTPEISPGIAPILTLAPSKFSRLGIFHKHNKSISPISPTFSLKSSFLLKLSPSPSTNTTEARAKRSSGSQLTLARRIRSDDRMNNNNFKEPKKKTLRQLGTYPFNENQGSVCGGPGSGGGGGGGGGVGGATGSSPVYPNVRRSTRLFTTSHNNLIKENTKDTKSSKYSPQKSQITRRSKPKTIRAASNLNSNTNTNNTKATKSDDLFDKNDKDDKSFNKSTDSLPVQCDDNSLLKICKQNVDNLVQLLKVFGRAYYEYSKFNCSESIEILSSLSETQYCTNWVQCLVALNYFEMNEYNQSAIYFEQVHRREPTRFAYMDKYSTVLWHLQREVALSALSEKLLNYDKNSPITWCVAGNCFSLHKEHDIAIKFLRRAVQVDPNFTYGYTLLGHEYIVTEELDKALNCFRSAVRLDKRHYNAWFGIGTIYSKQERYQLAEANFKRALDINGNSSVLMCHIAVSQQSQKQWDKALSTLSLALEKTPNNSLCKFHRSSILISIGKFEDALRELEELKSLTPREPLVYYLIGKVHGKLGNTDLALMHYSWASDLDPKGSGSHAKIDVDSSISRNQMMDDTLSQPLVSASASASGSGSGSGSASVSASTSGVFHDQPSSSLSINNNNNTTNNSNVNNNTNNNNNSILGNDRVPFHGFPEIVDDLDF